MNKRAAAFFATGVGLLVALVAAYLSRSPGTSSPGVPFVPETAGARPALSTRSTPPSRSAQANLGRSPLDATWAQLWAGAPSSAALAELRLLLLSGDPRQGIAAIRAFLATGHDAPTGESFELGEGGALAGAPTLRVLLLDVLGQLAARAGSDEAARAGREILNTKTSADEWAVSLRNVGQYEPASTTYLAAKAREMLTYDPWKSAPSGGFLESFDVPVFTGDASFLPVFSDFAHNGSAPLQRAATVALDRLSEASPLAVMDYLNSHPTEFADRPFLRADYYGKADLSDPPQRAAIETYLTRTDVTAAEKTKLIASLASPASFISDALLSPPALRPEAPARIGAVAATFQTWTSDARFPELNPAIQQTLRSLQK